MISFSAVIVAILDLFRKKSKIVFVITVIFLWSILAFTYGDADESVYISRYTDPQAWIGHTELLFALCMSVASKMGLTFYQYKAIITGIELILICSTIRKMAKYPNFVLFCYMIVPFALNVTQMRNALSTAIFIYFSRYLFEHEKIGKAIKLGKHIQFDYTDIMYVIGIMLATLVHAASFIWLVLLVAKKYDVKTCLAFMVSVNLLLQFAITPQNITKIISVVSKAAASRMIPYLTVEYQNSEWRHHSQILYVALVGAIICVIFYLIKKKKKNFNISKDTVTALKINICILIIFSLMFKYTQELYRLQEGLFIINYITITNTIKNNDMNSTRISARSFGIIMLLIVYIAFSAWFLIYHYLIPTVINPILQNNYLWNIIK